MQEISSFIKPEFFEQKIGLDLANIKFMNDYIMQNNLYPFNLATNLKVSLLVLYEENFIKCTS